MYDSFGDGYGTRSDEEGFGGIYGRNQELSKDNEPKPKHGENHGNFKKSKWNISLIKAILFYLTLFFFFFFSLCLKV